jgi:hypothetical protein
MFIRTRLLACLALAGRVFADLDIYSGGALASGWENWSWSTDIDWASTSGPAGTSAISVSSGAYAALSVKEEGTFQTYAGLRFDISGAQPDGMSSHPSLYNRGINMTTVTISIQSTGSSTSSPNIALSALSTSISTSGYTTVSQRYHAPIFTRLTINFSSQLISTTSQVAVVSSVTTRGTASTSRPAAMVLL